MSKHDQLLIGESKANIDIGSPYPGLRPFQDEDAEYFFGRDSQIKEVVTRLRNNRFVAVIGGSGSGKSSLVLAGAIPKLRTFAIRDSGDFWVPIITTPGTNHADGDSPIRRLANKFCSVLNELSPHEEQERLEHCTQLLREHNGLEQVIKKWGRHIKNNDGVDLSLKACSGEAYNDGLIGQDRTETGDQSYLVKVNFLFLIDQFEELFHPSNSSVNSDCKHLVDRIVDHFKQGSQNDSRVCVAITMRSEHLNDCPRYPELPDAINAAAYLVKRLNDFELREAIERPAKRFLRRQFLEAYQHSRDHGLPLPDEDEWPEDIAFDAAVVNRLLCDADKIIAQQDHADHLPLLQHLLYWIWISAMKRNGDTDHPFPDAIITEDLFSAIDPSGKTAELAENTNTLTQCLKQRCEWIFNRYPDRCQAWGEVFRSLAFKEPNTGTYTQRRASMAELCIRPHMALSSREELNRLLKPWLGPHQYVFWDESSQTVKVTHESLIRRWKRFRDWADLVDRQFQEYLQILEDCTHWIDNGRKSKELIEGVALRRAEDCRLLDALKDDGIQKQFDSLLRMHRDRDRLKRGVKSVNEFLSKSFNKRLNIRRFKRGFYLLGASLVISILVVAYWRIGVQVDDQQKTLLRSYGIAAETVFGLPPDGSVDKLDELQLPLGNVLAAITLQEEGGDKSAVPFLSRLYGNKLDASHKFALLAGARTISGLRRVLLGNVWRYEPDAGNHLKSIKTAPLKCKVNVQSTSREASNKIDVKNKEVEFYTSKERDGYGLIALLDTHYLNTQVFWGTREGKNCFTNFQQLVYWSTPGARLGFDAKQRTIVDSSGGHVTITSIDWPADGNPVKGYPLPTSTRLTYSNPRDKKSTEFIHLDGSARHVSLPTIPGEFTQDIRVGNFWFRIFDSYPVTTPIDPEKFARADDDDGLCERWKRVVSSKHTNLKAWGQKKTASEYFCLIISESKDNASLYVGDLYLVRDKDMQHLKDQNPFPIIGNIALGRNRPSQIRIGLESGYILSKSGNVWLKQPWSAKAWSQLAMSVFKEGYYLDALKKEVNESRYLRANWLFQDEDDPYYWKQLVEKKINTTPIHLAKTIVSKE